MPDVTKTIGTSSRDYSTWTLWEADLTNTTYASANTRAIGEGYNDSAFDEGLNVSYSATNITHVHMTVASGQRHNGTAGTGCRFDFSSFRVHTWTGIDLAEWLEVDGNGFGIGSGVWAISLGGGSKNDYFQLKQLIIHHIDNDVSGGDRGIIEASGADNADVDNCLFYSCINQSSGSALGYYGAGVGGRGIHTQNCTVFNMTSGGTGALSALVTDANASQLIRNCISMDTSGAGAEADFYPTATATLEYNLSSDTTAVGTGSLTSKSSANQFVSNTPGSEDLHLKAGADAIDAGSDRGTSPSGIQYDIDNYDRDAGGGAWDIGADEFVAGGGATEITGTDTVVVQASEVSVVAALLNAADSNAVQASEQSVVSVLIAASESVKVQASESSVLDAFLAATESCAIRLTENSDVLTQVAATEALVVALSEQSHISAVLAATEACAVQLSEMATIVGVLDVAESCRVVASEAHDLRVVVAASETLGVTLSEAYAVLVTLAASESVAVILTEVGSVVVQGDGTVSIFAADNVAVISSESPFGNADAFPTDSLVVQASEATALSVLVAVTDACATLVSESASVAVLINAADAAAVQVSEQAFFIISVAASDAARLGMTETSTLLASLDVSEALVVVATESVIGNATASASDSAAIQVGDQNGLLVSVTGFAEALGITAAEAAHILDVKAVSDGLVVGVLESGVVADLDLEPEGAGPVGRAPLVNRRYDIRPGLYRIRRRW